MILNAGFEARDGRIAVASNSQIPATTQDSPVGTPYLARFSEFDVTTVIVYLLGLLAILLSFDVVSGEKEKGTLEVGKLADMVVIDRDYLTCPEDEIREIQPVVVMIEGKVVYQGAG